MDLEEFDNLQAYLPRKLTGFNVDYSVPIWFMCEGCWLRRL